MSTLNVANITDGTDTVATGYVVNGSAKAWVRYYQVTPSISQSFNVASVTDVGTGQSTVNFTSGLDGYEYPAPTNQSFSSSELGVWSWNNGATTTKVRTRSNATTDVDRAYNLAQFGDLA
jgi:hypothetical protein